MTPLRRIESSEDWVTYEAVPDVLYHYTTSTGLLGILGNGELWSTDIAYLNDASELDYGRSVIDGMINAGRLGPTASIDRAVAKFVLEVLAAHTKMSSTTRRFVSCFCTDGDLLSQWARYAGGPGGYSVGFRASDLLECRGVVAVQYELVRMHYLRDDQEADIAREITKASVRLRESSSSRQSAFEAQQFEEATKIAHMLVTYKHQAFLQENEWRTIAYLDFAEVARSVRFRVAPLGMVPYVALDIRRGDEDLPCIEKIVIGPGPNQDLALQSLETLLMSKGFRHGQVLVSSSRAPIR